ncbi:MAG: dihydropteroate synthase [Methanomassiliicoccus sp.]|nr:dihydropteroate synthase [Methanomassiliicoccus sp.]
MIFRLRSFRSPDEVRGELSRLKMDAPPSLRGSRSLGLFIEGRSGELEDICRQAKEHGIECSFSIRGSHPRVCLLGGVEDLMARAEEMLGPDLDTCFRYHRSNDAPAVSLPGGRLTFERPLVMGILNVTPDSFSDGAHASTEARALRALAMTEEGADIIDVGGESTRPGATSVSLDEELRRTVPVIAEIAERTDVPISIDTMKPEVARRAIEAGARIINDVSGLRSREMVEVASEAGVPVILMHMLGEPQTMQRTVGRDSYDDVISDVMWFWEERMEAAERLGLPRGQVILDPGIGFGKLAEHNLEILERTRELRCSMRPLLIGASRKGFVTRIAGDTVERRAGGSVAAATVAVMNGASIVRVHEVPETVGAVRFIDGLRRSR